MLADLATVAWREWLEWRRQYGSRRAAWTISLVMLVIFGFVLPLQIGAGWLSQGEALYAWMVLPVILLLRSMGDTFAGERERHTLETLLATRIPDRALYLGKMIVPLAWAWLFTQVVILVALVPAWLLVPSGGPGIYSLPVFAAGLLLSLLTSLYAASAGVYLSLRARTVDSANQSMFVVLILFAALVGAVRGAYAVAEPAASLLSMSPVLAGVFLLADMGSVGLAARAIDRRSGS